jgi:CheY-like chemotaxis protein
VTRGHTVELAENAAQARAARERMRPDLVLLDIWMPDVDGITLLKEWSGAGLLTMPVVMMSGHGTIDTAVEATKYGASAFLEKPITLQKLLRSVDQALQPGNQRRPAPAPVMAALGWPRSDVLLPAGAGNVALGGNGGAPAGMPSTTLTPVPTAARRPSRASTSTARCARRATPSRRATSNSTWPRRTAR